jgi:hypothetical protein
MNKKYQDKKITMAHGSGGKASSDLIKDIFVDTFNNDYLATMGYTPYRRPYIAMVLRCLLRLRHIDKHQDLPQLLPLS